MKQKQHSKTHAAAAAGGGGWKKKKVRASLRASPAPQLGACEMILECVTIALYLIYFLIFASMAFDFKYL